MKLTLESKWRVLKPSTNPTNRIDMTRIQVSRSGMMNPSMIVNDDCVRPAVTRSALESRGGYLRMMNAGCRSTCGWLHLRRLDPFLISPLFINSPPRNLSRRRDPVVQHRLCRIPDMMWRGRWLALLLLMI